MRAVLAADSVLQIRFEFDKTADCRMAYTTMTDLRLRDRELDTFEERINIQPAYPIQTSAPQRPSPSSRYSLRYCASGKNGAPETI